MCHLSELLVPGFGRPVLCRGKMPRARAGYGAFRQLKFEYGCCEMLVFRVCGVRLNICDQSLPNSDLVYIIFYCLLASMAAVHSEDFCASFLFVGDLNDHQEWLGSTTNSHEVAAFDMATIRAPSLIAISWLSAKTVHVVEHFTSS